MTVKKLRSLIRRHWEVFRFLVSAILPAIVRTGKRPVMFDRYGGIGDMLCSFPAASELMKRHPGAVFFYHCPAEFACLPKLAGLNVQTYTPPHGGLVQYWYGWLLQAYYKFDYIDEDPQVHSREILIKEFARTHGVQVGENHPSLHVSAEMREKIQAVLTAQNLQAGPLVVIHPGPSWPVREWPRDSWVSLVKKLREQRITNVVQLGIGRHSTLGETDAPDVPGIPRLADRPSLEETVALIARADLFVGIDSGPLHIAVSVKTPAVGLWGPTAPWLRFSSENARSFLVGHVECLACHHRYPRMHWVTGCPNNVQCMKSISVEEVLAACLNRLKPKLKS